MSAVLKFDDNVFNLPHRGGGGSGGNPPLLAIAAIAGVIARDNHERDASASNIHRMVEAFKARPDFPHAEWESLLADVEQALLEVVGYRSPEQ